MVVRVRRFILTIIVVSLFLSVFYVVYPIETCRAGDTIHVYSGSSIQDAINSSNPGDTIYVHIGIYNENLSIYKSITLTGEGSSSVTISYSGEHTIKVTANNVVITGLKIQNTFETYHCVFFDSVTGCEISNCYLINGYDGIYLHSSNGNTIEDNIIESHYYGIYAYNSDSNIIKNNNIQNNNVHGIWLTSTSTGNTIYLNDFSDNLDGNAKDQGSNSWDYNSEGNYWDDYNNYDLLAPYGKGDVPYTIAGGAGNQDNYPLGDFLSPNQEPIANIDSISPNPASLGDTIYFNGDSSDDGTIVAWEWKSNGIVISTSGDFSTSSLSEGTHTISFRVQDNDGEWSSDVYETLVIRGNQKPNAYILEPTTSITKQYGLDIRFLGQGSDDGDIVGYSWRSSLDDFLNTQRDFTRSNLSIGQHTIYLKVQDDEGEWSDEVSITVTITASPSNNPPVADTGGSYTGYANQSVSFDGSNSYDLDDGDNIASYSWDFGDGSTGEGISPTHTYTSKGNYTVNLSVTDSNGLQSKRTTYANISEQVNGGSNGGGNGTPGFEVILVIIAILSILALKRKRKN